MSRAERLSDKIAQTVGAVYRAARGYCQAEGCGKRPGPSGQSAHVLPQDDLHIARYGEALIQHPANQRWTCNLACNKKVEINYRGHPIAADAFAESLREIMEEE